MRTEKKKKLQSMYQHFNDANRNLARLKNEPLGLREQLDYLERVEGSLGAIKHYLVKLSCGEDDE